MILFMPFSDQEPWGKHKVPAMAGQIDRNSGQFLCELLAFLHPPLGKWPVANVPQFRKVAESVGGSWRGCHHCLDSLYCDFILLFFVSSSLSSCSLLGSE